jgi:hypothetical protein
MAQINENSFNGGKQMHIFKTEGSGDPDNSLKYLCEYTCEEAKQALEGLVYGTSTAKRKIDGSCGLIQRSNGVWTIYQRYDDKKNKISSEEHLPENYINLPKGENPDTYKSDYRNRHNNENPLHHYYFKRIERNPPSVGEKKISDSVYSIVDNMTRVLDKDIYSVELVGPNFNRTPTCEKNGIALHEDQVILHNDFPKENTCESWHTWLFDYFSTFPDEGIIVCHKNKYWKIHSNKFLQNLRGNYSAPNLLF